MNITRAISIIFQDREWTSKLIITAIVTLLSVLLSPVLVGLAGWAALFGYEIDIIRGVRAGSPTPLPRWDDFTRFLSNGAPVLVGFIVYNLPNALVSCCSWMLLQSAGGTMIAGGSVALGVGCCLFPLLLIYNVVAMPLLALAMGRYSEDPRVEVFFQFASLFEQLRTNTDAAIQWLIGFVVSTLVFAIPVIGWFAGLALLIPIHGVLAGLFASQVLGGKPMSSALPRRPTTRR